jgi:hypothetical protein
MPGVGIAWKLLKRLAVEGFGPVEVARLVKRRGGKKKLLEFFKGHVGDYNDLRAKETFWISLKIVGLHGFKERGGGVRPLTQTQVHKPGRFSSRT